MGGGWPAYKGRGEQRAAQPPYRAVEINWFAAALPQAPDDCEGLLQATNTLRERDAVRFGILPFAVADPEDGAPPGQMIERDEGLRQRCGVAAKGLRHSRTDAHPPVTRRHHSHHDEWIEVGVG